MEFETCDICGKQLSVNNGEDFFEEDDTGSHVFCEKHWVEYFQNNKMEGKEV